ncbi:MAG: hypothetical protein IJM34_01150 [Lachnospiraceae bacterium]|nr:hypothetical protein [Lachnospiraceae bacterium]
MKKKVLAVVMAAGLSMAMAACTSQQPAEVAAPTEAATAPETTETSEPTEAPAEPTEAPTEAEEPVAEPEAEVMTYADYVAAEVDDPVVVEAYVQANQSWWDGKITVYAQDKDGAYFIYNMACDSQEEADKLTKGTKIRVNGFKAEWSGEIEIADATYEIVDGDTYVAEPVDVTDLLGKDELIDKQNQLVSFKDMTVVSVAYKNDTPGDDIYVKLSKDDAEYDFCLEYYLNGSDQEFYDLVGGLKAGDVVDVEGFLYWYEGVNTHITAVTVK